MKQESKQAAQSEKHEKMLDDQIVSPLVLVGTKGPLAGSERMGRPYTGP